MFHGRGGGGLNASLTIRILSDRSLHRAQLSALQIAKCCLHVELLSGTENDTVKGGVSHVLTRVEKITERGKVLNVLGLKFDAP